MQRRQAGGTKVAHVALCAIVSGCGGQAGSNASGTASEPDTGTGDGVGTRTDGVSDTSDPGGDTAQDTADTGSTGTAPPTVEGEFTVLTYNVAGLPQGISGSDPERNIPQISPLLNAFSLALVQEDFWYHDVLVAEVSLPFVSEPYSPDPAATGIGDGLNRMAVTPFGELARVQWYDCFGQIDCASDCLARKGWSMARHTLAQGVELDVYNLHMEAGGCEQDVAIRLQATLDLADAIAQRSEGRAVLVAGDFNLSQTDPQDVEPLANIIEGAGLTDVCDALECGDQRIDHIMIRSGTTVTLAPQIWWIPDAFVDARTGQPLSDHLPVAAQIAWTG